MILSRLRLHHSCLKKLARYLYVGLEYSQHFTALGKNWEHSFSSKPIAVLWGFSRWKWETMAKYLPEYRILLVNSKKAWSKQRKILDRSKSLVFIVWGYQTKPEVVQYACDRGFPLYVMEDGFIRSVDLGCKHTEAQSLVLDSRGIYFDATRPSDLEHLLNTYDFSSPPALLEVSAKLMAVMKTLGVSKYNFGERMQVRSILGCKKDYRILVIGQLESDASLQYGLASDWTNMRLLQKAHEEHPKAEIIYRPHPDTLHLQRDDSTTRSVREKTFYRTLTEPVMLADLFAEVDHVYTITSLSGFEALLHGLRVTVTGMPFYAGWGLTDDRQHCPRRVRRLTLEELFCAAYLLYPRYLANPQSPVTGCLETICQVVSPRLELLSKDAPKNLDKWGSSQKTENKAR